MFRRLINPLGLVLQSIFLFCHLVLNVVDREPYQEKRFYKEMLEQVTDLSSVRQSIPGDSLLIGWSKVNITPDAVLPLAGYGGRKPKAFDAIHDSVFVRTVVFESTDEKVAYVSADLLIIHPELTQAVYQVLGQDWNSEQIFLTATHTHSSIGAWAPGFVGNLFAGSFDPEVVKSLAGAIARSIRLADERKQPGAVTYSELDMSELVKNRLAGAKGTIDPWIKTLKLKSAELTGYLNVFSAHATCLSRHYREMSADYPGYFNHLMEQEPNTDISIFSAGAVGSMGPVTKNYPADEWKEVLEISHDLKESMDLLDLLNPSYQSQVSLRSFEMTLPMRKPGLKVTRNLQLRPWVFQELFGDYPLRVKGLILGDIVFLGMPCDFSGELAIPLYKKAEALGFRLIITSFNGGYGGYIIKDEWYDLPRYEARTMSWYGPDAGAYLSETCSRILHNLAQPKATE